MAFGRLVRRARFEAEEHHAQILGFDDLRPCLAPDPLNVLKRPVPSATRVLSEECRKVVAERFH